MLYIILLLQLEQSHIFVQGHVWMPGTQGAVRKGNVMALSPAAPLDFVTVMTFVIHSEIVAMTLQKSTAHRKVINRKYFCYFQWNPTYN